MSETTGTFHLSHPRLDGPAERTVVQPWLTELTHATLNAYADTRPALAVVETLSAAESPAAAEPLSAVESLSAVEALSAVESLPVQTPAHVPGRRVPLAA